MNPQETIIEIGGNTYSIGKLSPRKQFHVARRLEIMASHPEDANDELCDYVLDRCLSVCKRKQGEGAHAIFAPVQSPNSQELMFADIAMDVMLQLVGAVIKENLGSFFPIEQLASTAKA